MTDDQQSLLEEASNPRTETVRLTQLARNKLTRGTVASNPNCPVEILNGLAADHPREVLSNPSLQLAELEECGNHWQKFDIRSITALLAAAGASATSGLENALRQRFKQACEEVYLPINVTRVESWNYRRSLNLEASENDWLNEAGLDELSLDVSLEVLMQGNDIVNLDLGQFIEDLSTDQAVNLLNTFRDGSVESLFDICGGGLELDLVMEKEIRETTTVSSSADNIAISDTSVLCKKNKKKLLQVSAFYQSSWENEDEPVSFDEDRQILQVPIHEHWDTYVEDTRYELCSRDDLGDLTPLWEWEPAVFAPEISRKSWTTWIASKLTAKDKC